MPAIDVVADASVALQWFHAAGEEEVDAARELLERHARREVGLMVLDLTAYEIGNSLLRGPAQLPARRVALVLDALADICPRVTPTRGDMRIAAALAERHDLTLYDAAYAAVARARGAELATLGRALLGAGLGRRPNAILADME